MPVRLNVGLSKKVGLPDFGSLGATCNVELELDGAILQHDLDRFHKHVQHAFLACRQAVQDELSRQGGSDGARSDAKRGAGHGSPNGASREAAGARAPAQRRVAGENRTNTDQRAERRASRKQLEYATELAGRISGLGVARLDELTQRMFRRALSHLSSLEASSLIETLKDLEAGKIDPRAAFGEVAA